MVKRFITSINSHTFTVSQTVILSKRLYNPQIKGQNFCRSCQIQGQASVNDIQYLVIDESQRMIPRPRPARWDDLRIKEQDWRYNIMLTIYDLINHQT